MARDTGIAKYRPHRTRRTVMTNAISLQMPAAKLWLFSLAVAAALTCSSTLAEAQTVAAGPNSGHPGQSVNVSGTAFGASEAVDVYFDTTDVLLDGTNS